MNKTPELRFKNFNDDWINITLGELLEFKNGINASRDKYGAGVKFINVLDILNNSFITYEKIIGKVDIDDEIFKKNAVNYGDILFQRSSETPEDIGTSSVYLDTRKATFGGFVIRGKKVGEYNPLFMNYALKYPGNRKKIIVQGAGAQHYNIGQESLSKIDIWFPSMKEQEKIADFFSTLDSRIEIQEEKIENLEDQKKGYMQRIFSQEIRFKDENGEDYPYWEEKRLEALTEYDSSKISLNALNEDLEEIYPLYDANSICRYVDFYDEDDDYISIIKDGAGVGRLFYSKGKSSILGTMGYIRNRPNVDIKFLFYLMQTLRFDRYIVGGAIPHIYYKDYKKAELKIPKLPEQQKIANFLSVFDDKIEIEKKILETLQEMKRGFLQKMFV